MTKNKAEIIEKPAKPAKELVTIDGILAAANGVPKVSKSIYDETLNQGHLASLIIKKKQINIEKTFSCREQFLYEWERKAVKNHVSSKILVISISNVNRDEKLSKLKNFMKFIEDKLNLPEDSRTRFVETDKKPNILVRIPKWWREEKIRISLYTIFLRAAISPENQGSEDLDDIVGYHPYLNQTKEAVKKFLNGYTKLQPGEHFNISQWRDKFNQQNLDKLIKPEVIENV